MPGVELLCFRKTPCIPQPNDQPYRTLVHIFEARSLGSFEDEHDDDASAEALAKEDSVAGLAVSAIERLWCELSRTLCCPAPLW